MNGALPVRVIPCRSLGEYINRLIDGLEASDPEAAARIRLIVGDRRARIRLDEEAVDVRYEGGRLRAVAARGGAVDGEGRTTRAATLDLLDGYLEVGDAVLDGRLELIGTADDVSRMLHAVEVLLDGAARDPALQGLARDFRDDPCLSPPVARTGGPVARRTRFYPDRASPAEISLLARLDLLP
jgi:hypothetical protein